MFKMDLRRTLSRGARRLVGGASALALVGGAAVAQPAPANAQSDFTRTPTGSVPTSGPAANGEPAWFIYQAPPRPPAAPGAPAAPGGGGAPRPNPPIQACAGDAAKLGVGGADRNELMKRWKEVSPACVAALELPTVTPTTIDQSGTPTCVRSVICMSSNGQGISWSVNPSGLYNGGNNVRRVQWRSNPVNLGYKPTYPYAPLIQGANGAVSVAVDSKDNVWVVQRAPIGVDSISKFDANGKRLLTLGDSVVGHLHKAHGMNVDAQDNAYFADPSGAVIIKVSPEGKVLGTIGTRGKRGDWDEAKGQRLLWEPVSLAFDPRNGDMYIGEGHGAESPNDRQSGEPHNTSGASRVIRLDKNGKFISQIYGNMMGPGHFWQAHDLAIDPTNGDLWIGDREEYRIVIYTNAGEYKKTLQMRNLVCNISFDPKTGDPWIGTGLDSQFLRLNRDGKILGVIGNGPGTGDGEIGETGYIRWDSKGNLIAGSTTQARVVKWVAPQNQK
jgi:hypothetical protein